MNTTIDALEMVVEEEVAGVPVYGNAANMTAAETARALGIPVVGELSSKTRPEDFAYFARAARVTRESAEAQGAR